MEKLQLACLSLPYLQYLSLLFQSFSKIFTISSDPVINNDSLFSYLNISMQVHNFLTEIFLLHHDISLSFKKIYNLIDAIIAFKANIFSYEYYHAQDCWTFKSMKSMSNFAKKARFVSEQINTPCENKARH